MQGGYKSTRRAESRTDTGLLERFRFQCLCPTHPTCQSECRPAVRRDNAVGRSVGTMAVLKDPIRVQGTRLSSIQISSPDYQTQVVHLQGCRSPSCNWAGGWAWVARKHEGAVLVSPDERTTTPGGRWALPVPSVLLPCFESCHGSRGREILAGRFFQGVALLQHRSSSIC